MSVVYVRDPHVVVRKKGQQLRVTEGEKEKFTIPLANLEQLVVMGNTQLTTPAAVLLLNANVDVVFMSMYGKYRGRLITNTSKFAQLRHRQLRMCDDPSRSLDVAGHIVAGKIQNQRVVLQRRAEEDSRAKQAFKNMVGMLQAVDGANDLDQLRGYEGKAGAYYFDGVKTFFNDNWGFRARQYYPPPDPANAMLSLAYTFLLKDVESKIQLVGLDPYLGFFHTLGYNRPSLALDLMEEFRPIVSDIVVLSAVMDKQITLEDFERTNQQNMPVRMSKNAVEKLVRIYEERLKERIFHPLANGETNLRRAIELQIRHMARVIQGEESRYQPLVLR